VALIRPYILAAALAAAAGGVASVAHAQAVEERADAAATHQSGLNLTLERVVFYDDSTLVAARVENRSQRPMSLNAAQGFVLRDDRGGVYPLAAPATNREVSVAPGARIDGAFVFVGRVDPKASRLSLEVGRALGAMDAQPLKVDLPLPPRPAAVAAVEDAKPAEAARLDIQANHPNGSTLVVTGLAAAEDSIALDLVATNGGRGDVRLNGGRGLVLVDEAGGVHALVPPKSNPELVVPPGRRLDAALVFAGRPTPGARHLRLVTNEQAGGSADSPATPQPVFTLDLPLDPAREPPPPLALASHPNGLQLAVRDVRRTGDRIVVDALIVNGHARPVRLNNAGGLRLLDEAEGRHALRPPVDGPDLEIGAAERADAVLVFEGATDGPLKLVTNEGLAGSTTNAFTALPVLRLDLPPARAVDGAAPDATTLARRALPGSRAEDGQTRAAVASAKPGAPDATLIDTAQ
jgi:hypothetical protein